MSTENPANFLDLVRRLSIEIGDPGDGPTTLSGATGQTRRLMMWINQAWIEINEAYPDWDWNRVTPGVSFVTVAAQTIYTPTQAGVPGGEVGHWDKDTFRTYLTTGGTDVELHMQWVPYDEWRDVYNFGSMRTAQVQPMIFSILPNLSLALQCPLVGYTVTGDYFTLPSGMSADADIPALPLRYFMTIVYKAMTYYGSFESAPEVYAAGEEGYNRMMTRMTSLRMPEITAGGALA